MLKSQSYKFNFPAFQTEQGTAWIDQALHMQSEVEEVMEAIHDGGDAERVVEECLDVIHSAETLLLLIGKGDRFISRADLNRVYRGVIEKNRNRGYYGGDA